MKTSHRCYPISFLPQWTVSLILIPELILLVTFVTLPVASYALSGKRMAHTIPINGSDFLSEHLKNEQDGIISSSVLLRPYKTDGSVSILASPDSCQIIVYVDIVNVTCSGDSTGKIIVTIDNGEYPISYVWSNGESKRFIENIPAGEYTVTVTDAIGCESINSFTVAEPPPLIITVDSLVIPDTSGSGLIWNTTSGGTPPYAYHWEGGDFGYWWNYVPFYYEDANNLFIPGNYIFRVTDSAGCSTYENIQATQADSCLLSVGTKITDSVCAEDSTGEIRLQVENGIYPLSYLWSSGEHTPVLEHLSAGNYTVTVTDADDCESINVFTIPTPTPFLITVDSLVLPDSLGSGLIWITVTGGTAPYTYFWEGGDFGAWGDPGTHDPYVEDANNLFETGNYSIIVGDALGCITYLQISAFETVSVTKIDALASIKVYPVPANDMLYVDMEQPMKEVLITGIDGRLCKYIVSPGSNRLDINDLAPGWYNLRISDGSTWYSAKMVK